MQEGLAEALWKGIKLRAEYPNAVQWSGSSEWLGNALKNYLSSLPDPDNLVNPWKFSSLGNQLTSHFDVRGAEFCFCVEHLWFWIFQRFNLDDGRLKTCSWRVSCSRLGRKANGLHSPLTEFSWNLLFELCLLFSKSPPPILQGLYYYEPKKNRLSFYGPLPTSNRATRFTRKSEATKKP